MTSRKTKNKIQMASLMAGVMAMNYGDSNRRRYRNPPAEEIPQSPEEKKRIMDAAELKRERKRMRNLAMMKGRKVCDP